MRIFFRRIQANARRIKFAGLATRYLIGIIRSMNIRNWLKANPEPREHTRVAKRAGTSVAYLKKLAYTGMSASPRLAEKLAKASKNSPGGAMTELHILYPERDKCRIKKK